MSADYQFPSPVFPLMNKQQRRRPVKKLNILVSTVLLAVIFVFGGCSPAQTTADALTVTPNITLSGDAARPPVNASVTTITFKFDEPLDAKTITGAVKLYKLDVAGNAAEEKCFIKIDPTDPALLRVNNKQAAKFPDGEEYKVVISRDIKSITGRALENEFTGFFATNHNFMMSGNPDLNNARTQIVVISDLHLGIDDAFAEIRVNRQPLADFLGQIRTSPNVKELVIAGDLIDEWFIPMNYVTPQTEAALADAVAANNRNVIDAFNNIIKDGLIKVTYTPGNHDIAVTEADIARIMPGINQAREDVQGLGTYVTGVNSEIAIEHGHRYNFFCAPDPFSNRDIVNDPASIMPPGYFFTRIATSSVVEGHPSSNNVFPQLTAPDEKDLSQYGYYLYGKIWEAILATLPVNESFTDKAIKTNIDGYNGDFAINDLLPQQNSQTGKIDVTLYHGIPENWVERQKNNHVAVLIPLKDASLKAADSAFTDAQAKTQYFDRDATKKIVIFGHTHVVRNLLLTNLHGDNVIYANSGTWIDNAQGYPHMTFVVITLPNSDSAIESVNVYKYAADKTVTQWEDGQVLTAR
jgi:UDP-2,3-diacylglucosamine pyrophosphatase LpxH